MSILAHLIYDEAQARSYQAEAETILGKAPGSCHLSHSGYRKAATAVVRALTLYGLYHEPGTAPAPDGHSVRMTVPEERYDMACRSAREFLCQSSAL